VEGKVTCSSSELVLESKAVMVPGFIQEFIKEITNNNEMIVILENIRTFLIQENIPDTGEHS